MSTDVDLVHTFMNLPEVSPEDLQRARSILDDAIALERRSALDANSQARPARTSQAVAPADTSGNRGRGRSSRERRSGLPG